MVPRHSRKGRKMGFPSLGPINSPGDSEKNRDGNSLKKKKKANKTMALFIPFPQPSTRSLK